MTSYSFRLVPHDGYFNEPIFINWYILKFQTASTSYIISFKLLSFNNPGGKGIEGFPCDIVPPCEYMFWVCLDYPTGNDHHSHCQVEGPFQQSLNVGKEISVNQLYQVGIHTDRVRIKNLFNDCYSAYWEWHDIWQMQEVVL